MPKGQRGVGHKGGALVSRRASANPSKALIPSGEEIPANIRKNRDKRAKPDKTPPKSVSLMKHLSKQIQLPAIEGEFERVS